MYIVHGEETLNFLREYYPTNGTRFCAEQLGIKYTAVEKLVARLKIRRIIIPTFDVTPFYNIQTPEIAYILGLLWADGTINKINTNPKKSQPYGATILMVREDIRSLEGVFDKTGKWLKYDREPKNRKPVSIFDVNNKDFWTFLYNNDYCFKKTKSACKILSLIPDHLKHYWFRGNSDGDGCWYINKLSSCQYFITSTYDQDWTYLEKLMEELKVKYTVRRKERKRADGEFNRHSDVILSRTNDIVTLGNYLYQNYDHDLIGLSRKHDKFLKMAEIRKKNSYLYDTDLTPEQRRSLHFPKNRRFFLGEDVDNTIEKIPPLLDD